MTPSRSSGGLPDPFPRKRGDKRYWVARWYDDRGVRREVESRSYEKAKDKREQRVAGRQPHGTLGGYLHWWVEEHLPRRVAQERLSEQTRIQYAGAIRTHVTPRIGDVPLQQVTIGIVEDLLDRVATEPSPATGRPVSSRRVRAVYETLRSALAAAVRRELLDRNPCEHVETPPRTRREVEPLSRDEARRFVAAASDDPLAALWLVCLANGLRMGEALAISWSRVDLEEGSVQVGPSLTSREGRWILTGGKSQAETMALPGFAAAAFRRQWRLQAEQRMAAGPEWEPATAQRHRQGAVERVVLDDLVFTDEFGGPVAPWVVGNRLAKLCKRAEVRRMTPHELRHNCAALMLAQGATMAEVQLMLRHSSYAITSSTYAHLHDEVRHEWADRMDAALGDDQET